MAPTFIGGIADGLVVALQSPAVQTELVSAITAGEVDLKTFGDGVISSAKGSGALGLVIQVGKGSVEAEFDSELAKYTPAEIAAFITKMAVDEAKNLGG